MDCLKFGMIKGGLSHVFIGDVHRTTNGHLNGLSGRKKKNSIFPDPLNNRVVLATTYIFVSRKILVITNFREKLLYLQSLKSFRASNLLAIRPRNNSSSASPTHAVPLSHEQGCTLIDGSPSRSRRTSSCTLTSAKRIRAGRRARDGASSGGGRSCRMRFL
jgi:hypothetical protein